MNWNLTTAEVWMIALLALMYYIGFKLSVKLMIDSYSAETKHAPNNEVIFTSLALSAFWPFVWLWQMHLKGNKHAGNK